MSRHFNFIDLPLAGLYRVERKLISDKRGFFSRFYCTEEFKKIGNNHSISQINYTLTQRRGAIRGMHFQRPPHTETKIVSCIRGEVLDVVVDVRIKSPTFLMWHAELLSETNSSSLFIPDGFAHGFQTLSDDCQLIYIHSTNYMPDSEGALNPMDPKLDINWPLEVTDMSERDQNCTMLIDGFEGVDLP
jgi:dTDP-4-dehydrorhamnose 3,5-epimerase